jgi:hypothetical protein
MSQNPSWDKSLAFYRKFTPSVEDRDLWAQPLKGSVWRWFKSRNVIDLYRHRDNDELQRIGRMLRHSQDLVSARHNGHRDSFIQRLLSSVMAVSQLSNRRQPFLADLAQRSFLDTGHATRLGCCQSTVTFQ